MHIPTVLPKSNILYIRANLSPFARQIRFSGGVKEFFSQHFNCKELFAPYFMRARPFWEMPVTDKLETNSGALGKKLAHYPDATVSNHPSHRFVGFGERVKQVLQHHDYTTSCFYPIQELAETVDFSMLLLGCLEDSPGFSTVHATQYGLGLSQKHLLRYLLRWDIGSPQSPVSIISKESPGCSLSFGKFYPEYEINNNLIRGEIFGIQYLYVPSALQALSVEKRILSSNPRFVDCGRLFCTTCRLRIY